MRSASGARQARHASPREAPAPPVMPCWLHPAAPRLFALAVVGNRSSAPPEDWPPPRPGRPRLVHEEQHQRSNADAPRQSCSYELDSLMPSHRVPRPVIFAEPYPQVSKPRWPTGGLSCTGTEEIAMGASETA
jgi:hypothetical protein